MSKQFGVRSWTRIAVAAALMALSAVASTLSPSAARADTWTQVNASGFGKPDNRFALAIAELGDHVYVGTENSAGAQIFRAAVTADTTWKKVTPAWSPKLRVDAMGVYGAHLYVSATNIADALPEIWRTNGSRWENVTPSDPQWRRTIGQVTSFTPFGNNPAGMPTQLYLARTGSPYQIWRAADGVAWQKISVPYESTHVSDFASPMLQVHGTPLDPILVVGVGREMPGATGGGCEVYAYASTFNRLQNRWSMSWSKITSSPGFGFGGANALVKSMASFNGALFAGTVNHGGYQVWRYDSAPSRRWSRLLPEFDPDPGFFIPSSPRVNAMAVAEGKLFVGEGNFPGGVKVLASSDGMHFSPASPLAFGDSLVRSIDALGVAGGRVYASVSADDGRGVRIYRRSAGSSGRRAALDATKASAAQALEGTSAAVEGCGARRRCDVTIDRLLESIETAIAIVEDASASHAKVAELEAGVDALLDAAEHAAAAARSLADGAGSKDPAARVASRGRAAAHLAAAAGLID